MMLCMSSGLRARYLQDIVRAVSMPSGMHLRFRYEQGLIPPAMKDRWQKNAFNGQQALITYLDAADAEDLGIVPCRYATIVETRVIGTIFVISFRLEAFAHCDDSRRWSDSVKKQASKFPQRAGADFDGYLCEELGSSPQNVIPTEKVEDWQRLVTELSSRKDFRAQPFFFHVLGLRRVGSARLEPAPGGSYIINGESSYELSLVHYSPQEPNKERTPWLVVRSSDERISFASNPNLCLDSPYDEKVIRFRSESQKSERNCVLTFLTSTASGYPAGNISDSTPQFDLPLTLSTDIRRIARSG